MPTATAPRWTPADIPRLHGRTVVVTGANSGIGFEAALAFARAGAHVVPACRGGKAEEAADRLRAEVPAASLDPMELDLARLASVRAFSAALLQRRPVIDALCNNAGIMAVPRRQTTEDGFELQFGTNHLGHFALTGLLIGAVTAAPQGRVVTVSSGGHRGRTLDFADLHAERSYGKWAAYGRSKLANLLFAYELDRRLKAAGHTALSLACHPGAARSRLISTGHRTGGGRPDWWLRLAYTGAQSARAGALPTVRAAVDPGLRGGEYVGPAGLGQSRGLPAVVASGPASHDRAAAERLWAASEELTGVRFAL